MLLCLTATTEDGERADQIQICCFGRAMSVYGGAKSDSNNTHGVLKRGRHGAILTLILDRANCSTSAAGALRFRSERESGEGLGQLQQALGTQILPKP